MSEVDELREILLQTRQGIDFGTFTIIGKIHDGKMFNLDTQKFYTHKTPEGNPDAVKLILKLIKGMQTSIAQSKKAASLTFTLDMDSSGQSTKLIVQDTGKHRIL